MAIQLSRVAAVCGPILSMLALVPLHSVGQSGVPNTGMADPLALVGAFDRFQAGGGGGSLFVLSLANVRGVAAEAANGGGRVRIDLATGAVTSTVTGLPLDTQLDLWLVDNRPSPGHTTLAEVGDVLMKIGAYAAGSTTHTLSTTVGPGAFTSFFPDRAFVVRSGQTPLTSFVLTGPGTLFDRLRRRQVRFLDNAGSVLGFDPMSAATRTTDFTKLVADGRRLFVDETFAGNGRACGTCHVESNNFTIDPAFIATLPANDPLFVAETNPALAANFEKPDLMRTFGLILENVDGLDNLSTKFTLRATQTVLALANSTVAPLPNENDLDFSTNGRNPIPPERLGWGNDGLPLREFAIGAIVQHATKTLQRRAGIDFRVPTDEELDALAGYQLALGRQEDFQLSTLELKSASATKGKGLYLDTGTLFEPGHKNCNVCHFNAGGTAAARFIPGIRLDLHPRGFNIAAFTNLNETPMALSLGARLPRDGGFGILPLPNGAFGNTDDLPPPFGHVDFEDFNTPPLVEAADTGPFFHNHTVKTLEESIAFYGTQPFQTTLIGLTIPVQISTDPRNPEVQAIAAFLRVLNALENIRSAINLAERGRTMPNVADARDLARLALAESIDAIEVLSEGALLGNVEPSVLSARANLMAARALFQSARIMASPAAILNTLEQAAQNLRAARSALANPETLPLSFRN